MTGNCWIRKLLPERDGPIFLTSPSSLHTLVCHRQNILTHKASSNAIKWPQHSRSKHDNVYARTHTHAHTELMSSYCGPVTHNRRDMVCHRRGRNARPFPEILSVASTVSLATKFFSISLVAVLGTLNCTVVVISIQGLHVCVRPF